MGTLAIKGEALAIDVVVTADTLNVVLADGREISAPIGWFPLLMDATDEQRRNWRLIGGGVGIHWESLDEDISVAGLLSVR
jgi:hypothetical protein